MAAGEGDALARDLAVRVLERLPELTDELVEVILVENPAYRALGTVPKAELWRSCHDNLARVLELLAAGRPTPQATQEDLYDAAQATGRSRAEQAMPLDDVLGSFRLGGRLVWQSITEQARSDAMVDTDGLIDLGTRVWEGLLQGRAVEPGFAAQAGQLLGLPVRGPYTVVVVSVPQPGAEDTASWSLQGRLSAAGVESAWQLRADVLIGLLSLGGSAADAVLGVLRHQLRGPAGLSLVVQGLGEVGSAHAQAELARRTLGTAPAGLAALAQRLPEALLLGAPDLARSLIQEWLGPVLRLPASDRDLLLDTLVAWLESAGSAVRTAELVHCHRNTVVNRIRRIEELAGHSLHGGVAPLEMLLALRALTVLPGR